MNLDSKGKNWQTRANLSSIISTAMLSALCSTSILAQSSNSEDEVETQARGAVDEILVSGRRANQSISSMPNSVTVIDFEELDQQFMINTRLSNLLQFSVPGIAGQENTVQTPALLRGGTALILVDGVPQNQLLRSSDFDVVTIGNDAIGRVEVLRGSNAVFGFGATGGAINFITKRPVDEGYEVVAKVRGATQTSEGDFSQEVYGSYSANIGAVGFLIGASKQSTGVGYDAEGTVIPNDLSEYGRDISNIHGAIDWDINAEQRVLFTGNRYKRKADLSDYVVLTETGDPTTDTYAVGEFTGAFFTDSDFLLRGLPATDPASIPDNYLFTPEQEFNNATLRYQHDDFLGSALELTLLAHEFPDTLPARSEQGRIVSQQRLRERSGVRGKMDIPLSSWVEGSRLVIGADRISNSVDEGAVVDGVGYTRTTQRTTPYIDQVNLGVFSQLEVPIGDFLLSGGVRYDEFDIEMADAVDLVYNPGRVFTGGNVNYDAAVFNAGIVYYARSDLDVYFSFSQGLDVTQVGRAAAQVDSAAQMDPEAAVTDAYEIGFRAAFGRFRFDAASFYSVSELASRTRVIEAGTLAVPLRQPENIWGVEASGTFAVNDMLSIGSTFTWNDGEAELDDGSTAQLQNLFLSPTTLTAYADWQARPWLRSRLQAFHIFGEDIFAPGSGYARGNYETETLVDFSASFVSESLGELTIAVANLFNELTVAPGNRARNITSRYFPMEGRTVSLTYTKALRN